MNSEWLRQYCLSKPGTSEDFPFDEDTLVFRVAGRIFALHSLGEGDSVNLKADPGLVVEWRETYPQVQPGYHMNKTHWNTVYFEGLPESVLSMMVDESYRSVLYKLPKKIQKELSI